MKTLHIQHSNLTQTLLLVGVCGLLLPSPWIKTSIPFLLMQMAGLILALGVLLAQHKKLPVSTSVIAFIVYAMLVLSIYLVPLPTDTWLQLPGHNFYQKSIQLMEQTGNAMTAHSISIDAYATAQMLLTILPSLGVFLATSSLKADKAQLAAQLFVAMVAYQAAWGMIQYSSNGISAHGSYISRDHYVTLMEFALPLNIALIANHIRHHVEQDEMRHKLVLGFYLFSLVLIFLAGIFSMSRGGIPNLFLGLFLTSLLVFRQSTKSYLTLPAIILFLILAFSLANQTGIVPVINRFIGQDPLEDARWIMFTQQLETIGIFFPLGSGPGTFADVYAAFQPIDQVGHTFVSHAHNDYLELLVETGLIGVSIIVFFMTIYLQGWIKLWQKSSSASTLSLLQTAAGIGLLTSLLHAIFDFNFHIIAHPIIFSFLAGIFLKTAETS